ncbi:protein TolR [Sphingorhabdus lutea]|uniref:Protein TolR n=1 Tax=Sphingorhabdus lutea TaxID=1913578 RepID=A0A1L3JE01_9SPHN|nr:protein TolR [Sphingorhabdus lutea]APG63354.1 protein TolR [Sphingorhabdus lutea]
MAMNMSSGAKGRRGRATRRAPMAEINVTPLVDVMLVLLIIFMVTAPLLNTGVPLDLPQSRANALNQDKESIEISVDSAGLVYVDGEEVAMDILPDKLAQLAQDQDAQNPASIMLRGDTSIQYGQIMSVMGELNHAGLNQVNLVTTSSAKTP